MSYNFIDDILLEEIGLQPQQSPGNGYGRGPGMGRGGIRNCEMDYNLSDLNVKVVDDNICKKKNMNYYYTSKCYQLIFKGKLAGYATFGISTRFKHIGFFESELISGEFLRLSIGAMARYYFAKKYNIEKLYVTVKKNNQNAIRSCYKYNCTLLSDKKHEYLRSRRLLDNDHIRFVEHYTNSRTVPG